MRRTARDGSKAAGRPRAVACLILPALAPWFNGQAQFAFALQGVIAVGIPLGDGFGLTVALEVPVYFTPATTIGFTPLVGVTYRIPHRRDPLPPQVPTGATDLTAPAPHGT